MTGLLRAASLPAFLLAAAAAILPAPAAAGDGVPYRGRLDLTVTGLYEDGDTLVVTGVLGGNVTHLGRLTGTVTYYIDSTGAFTGDVVKVASNGDKLRETMVGQFLDPYGINAVGTFAFDGGTGRFSNASGTGDFAAEFFSPMEEGTVDVEATLFYDASDRRGG